jgi:hypothetical protein
MTWVPSVNKTSTTNIESTAWFDSLPTEIIFIIFDYLSSNDIIYTFFFFNQRFNNLLLKNQRYLTYLEFPTTNLKIWEKILSMIGSQIECLNINTIHLSFPLSYFSNLKSIIISSPFGLPDEELKYNHIFFDKDYLFETIFNHGNSLETLTIPLFYAQHIHNLKVNSNLHSMTLNIFSFENIFLLIPYTPNLKYLNVVSHMPHRNAHQISINRTNIKLKQLYLTLHYQDQTLNNFDFLTSSIKQFSSSLICLSINLIYLNMTDFDEIPLNSIKLQQFLESMIELKQFHLYVKLDKYSINCDKILSGFKNEYWFDHNWSFGMHRNYFYTLPFHFDSLYQFDDGFREVKSNNPLILINNRRIWFNVKSVELEKSFYYDRNFVRELKIKMPKLNSITLSDHLSVYKRETQVLSATNDEREKTNLRLDNVTTIQFTCGPIEDIKDWIISFLPNLRYLSLSFTKFHSIDNELIPILNQRIQRLDISLYSELEQLSEIDYVYFSNVEYIHFCVSYFNQEPKWYADVIMKILTNFKNLNSLLMYTHRTLGVYINPSYKTKLSKVIGYLDVNAIRKNYKVKYFRQYALFLKRGFIKSEVEDVAPLTSKKYSVSSRLIHLFFRKK